MTIKKFFSIVIESVLGVLMAMFLLLPSALAIADNPRTDTDNLLNGWLLWIYGYNQRLPSIISSLFFPPELPSQPNFFPEQGAKWSSMSAWLPLFSTCGVFAYLSSKKNTFVKRLIYISFFMACIPVLNSLFVLFNHSYYARWFYMPILMMALATAIALEERTTIDFKKGITWTCLISLFITLAVGLSPVIKDDKLTIGLSQYPTRFWGYIAYTGVSLLIFALILRFVKDEKRFKQWTTTMLATLIVGFTWCYIAMGKDVTKSDNWFIDNAINGEITLPDETFVRSDLYKAMDNLGMFWGLPNIQAFHSIIPGSTMKFYPEIGIKRDVSSKPPASYTYLRPFLSVRWLFIATNQEDQTPMPGYTLFDTQLGYNIYENNNYIPMGFAYDRAFTGEMYANLSGEQRLRYMIMSMYLDEEAAARNSDIITLDKGYDFTFHEDEQLNQQVQNRRNMSATSFTVNNAGFVATSNLDEERLMFFSVPHDKGWSATVNGKTTHIEVANIGFMAVRVPAGETTIVFKYFTPGLMEGLIISFGAFSLFGLYMWYPRKPRLVNTKENVFILPPTPEDTMQDEQENDEIAELLALINDAEIAKDETEDH